MAIGLSGQNNLKAQFKSPMSDLMSNSLSFLSFEAEKVVAINDPAQSQAMVSVVSMKDIYKPWLSYKLGNILLFIGFSILLITAIKIHQDRVNEIYKKNNEQKEITRMILG